MDWFTFSFSDFSLAFLSVLIEGIPFLLLGALISGLVDVYVSSERLAKMLPRNPFAAVLLSGMLGLIFPMCECGSVIVVRRFIRKGLPLSSATAYMLGAPIVSPIVAVSTWSAFSQAGPLTWTLLRLGIGYAIAVGVAFIVHRLSAESILQPQTATARRRSGLTKAAAPTGEAQDFSAVVASASRPRKLLLAAQSATADFLDVTFFFVIGVGITSVFNTAISHEALTPLASSTPLAIASLMGLAALLALCSTTDAFIAWTFTAFAPQAKLAFLLFGPLFDIKLFFLYGVIFRRRFVILLGLGLFVVIFLLCWRLPTEIFQ
ncbi:MAG: permease [Chthoniobacteraceae bacterium]